MDKAPTIGQRIRQERQARQLTQRELAAEVGVGVPHISKIEADRESPSDDLLARLAGVFGMEPDELMIAARRVPAPVLEDLASDPAAALRFLRTWPSTQRCKPTEKDPN